MSSLTHISNALNRFDERLSAIEADTRGFHNQFDSFVDILEKVCNKLVGIEKVQADQTTRLDHIRSFASHAADWHDKSLILMREDFDKVAAGVTTLSQKLDGIEKMLTNQAKRQDHTSAFARREGCIVRDQLSDIRESIATHARIAENILEQVEAVGADIHEYARQAAEELEVYGSGVDPEIDWFNLSVKERV